MMAAARYLDDTFIFEQCAEAWTPVVAENASTVKRMHVDYVDGVLILGTAESCDGERPCASEVDTLSVK